MSNAENNSGDEGKNLGGDATESPRPALARCERCRRVRDLINTGTIEHPFLECGTCMHRRERSINTREMWGRGRRGY